MSKTAVMPVVTGTAGAAAGCNGDISITALLERYAALLREVDDWFSRCRELYPGQIACHSGCSECCRGLFDITLLDALYLRQGIDALPELQKSSLRRSAAARLAALARIHPEFKEPWILNVIPESEWELLMPEDDETPCLLLSENGRCRLYDHRPMTCRLNGIPLIDISGEELFDEWCTLNFTTLDPRQLSELRFGFTELFAQELLLFQELLKHLTGMRISEVDTIIPAVVLLECDEVSRAVRKNGA